MMKRIVIFLVCMIMVTSTIFVLQIEQVKASGNIFYVGGIGPGNYTTIQSAIDAASSGDIVFVFNGIYYENVNINKDGIKLIGEDKNSTIIDASGGENGLYIEGHNYNFVSDFTVRNSGYAGIRLRSIGELSLTHNTISDCIVYNSVSNGILIHADCYSSAHADYNIITNCTSYNNNQNGILIHVTYYGTANQNQILNCKSYNNNWYGIIITGDDVTSSNIISNCEVYNNNGDGIFLEKDTICDFSGTRILKTRCYDNIGNGISAVEANGLEISNCTLCNNSKGISLLNSNSNKIYHNNLINNGQNAYDDGTNNWYNSTLQEGNYWSDYTGEDNNLDGIGDSPYSIPGGSNQDLYPLMQPNGWELKLIAHWNFDETTGDILHDVSGNGNDGTIYGAQWTTGISDGGLYFDGVDDYVNCGNGQKLNIANEITICAWIKFYAINYWAQVIVGKWSSLSSHSYVLFMYNLDGKPTGKPGFSVSFNNDLRANDPIEAGKWYFLTGTYNQQTSDYKFYLNGAVIMSSSFGGGISQSNEPLYIGHDTESAPCYFDGIIDEISIYNRALNAEEIQSLYNEYLNQPPVALFSFIPKNPMNSSVVQFTDRSFDSDGAIVSWYWDFGDHYYSDLQNPIHCYYRSGTYDVTLTVTDNDGAAISTTKTIIVEPEYVLDQKQEKYDYNNYVYNGFWYAQSFTPKSKTLRKVDLYIGKKGLPVNDLVVSIRKTLNGPDLTSISIPVSELSFIPGWVEVNFPDIDLIIGGGVINKYYIVTRTVGGSENNCYIWGYGTLNPYPGGSIWQSSNSGLNWIEYPCMDLCFRTYGY